MRLSTAAGWIGLIGSSLLAASVDSTKTAALRTTRSLQVGPSYANEGEDRVAGIDRTEAECIVGATDGAGGAVGWTEINFYYAIHANAALDQEKEDDLQSLLYIMIQTAILWCTLPKAPIVDVSRDGGRKNFRELLQSKEFLEFQKEHRRLTPEESRRLAIIAFSNNPVDVTIDDLFTLETTPCQFSTSPVCTMMEGKMGITANLSDNLDLIIASILDAIQEVMNLDFLVGLLCTEEPCSVTKVEYWGDTLAQVESNVDLILGAEKEEDEARDGDETPIFLFAAVPLVLLAAFMFLMAHNRQNRQILTPAEFADLEDYIITGTGDPPRSFHEGMYHYTRAGARYLSTNCRGCHETRKMGMLHSFSDLHPINEDRMYDATGRSISYSYDENSVSTGEVDVDPSSHRKLFLVQPSEKNLGQKASTVDVHQCSSATCRICAYKPKDVAFVVAPRDEERASMSYLPGAYAVDLHNDSGSWSAGQDSASLEQDSISMEQQNSI